MATEFYNRNWRMPNSWNGSTDNNSKVSNYSMTFDGSSEYIDCGTDIGNYFGEDYTGEMAISIWFKADTTSSDDGIFIFTGSSPLGEISAYIYLGDLEVRVRGVVVATGSFTDTSNWHNLIINLFGPSGANQVYLDGVAFDSTFTYTSDGLDFNGETFEIGHYGGTRYFSGKLDHCSIFDYALSAQQISDLQGNSTNGVGNPMSLSPKPKAFYPIGDYAAFNGSEYLVNNGALSDYNFTFNPTGNLNQSVSLNQSYSYTNITVSAWVKMTSNTNSFIYDNRDDLSNRVFIYYGTQGKFFWAVNNVNIVQGKGDEGGGNIQIGKWYHVVGTYDGTTSKLYVNNVSAQVTGSTTVNISSQNATIGALSTAITTYEARAELSNVQIFNTTLAATGSNSIETLYNNGTPLSNMSGFTSLVGWWKLDAWSIPDDSSNSNTGTSNGMTAANLIQSDLLITQPYSRYALNFDGVSDYATSDSVPAQLNTVKMVVNKMLLVFLVLKILVSVVEIMVYVGI
jgi:hypothetical protein